MANIQEDNVMHRKLTISLLFLFIVPLCARGQEFRATLNGRVTDPSKAAVPNATVIVRNPETNEAVTVTTRSEGTYSVPFLKPGIYSITVEAPGFKKYVRDRQELQVSQN